MKKVFFILICLFLGTGTLLATHNRAGEITYEHISGFTFKFTVTTYTSTTSQALPADRCELEIDYGDGTIDTIARINDDGSAQCSGCTQCGEMVGPDIKKNVYVGVHTFSGAFVYEISVTDPNRNAGILNINNSVNVPFSIQTTLVITPGVNYNNSLIMENPPIDMGCVGRIFEHNPGAYDPDEPVADSLSYSIVPCNSEPGVVIPNYVYPNEVSTCPPGGSLTIDSVTGTVVWDSPSCQGEFNLCILIEEWRVDPFSNERVKVGDVLRDMQITIIGNCDNDPPIIEDQEKLCVTAGDSANKDINAWDPNGDFVELTVTGEPFHNVMNPPAVFNPPPFPSDTVTGEFLWGTNCSHVRKNSYQAVFKAKDDYPSPSLVDFETLEILVVAPAPQNPQAGSIGNSIDLSWDPGACDVDCYKIYRRLDSSGWVPSDCETGVPAYAGYSLIAEINGNSTSFTDDNAGEGLYHGQQYCYRIVGCYTDGAESYASEEICEELKKDVPVITRVSVNYTDSINGSDTITWSVPTELDISSHPGPYFYKIYRAEDSTGANILVDSTAKNAVLEQADTIYVDTLINTKQKQYNYKVELYAANSSGDFRPVGETHTASSVFLSTIASDNKLQLNWHEKVPWTNSEYVVYKYNNALADFTVLDTISRQTYTDSGLVNRKEYCYYVKSIGSYSATGFVNPILNNSQVHCGTPIDTTAPCSPAGMMIQKDCELFENRLTWNNPNNSCADDVIGYNVYYAPFLGQELELIDSLTSPEDTVFWHDQLFKSIAGCYAVTAYDSFPYLNESSFSDIVCVDNCPVYELPNVFTPGGDGMNDVFAPFPYKFIDHIDLKIFNRWGEMVFSTEDPDINWDGFHQEYKKPCTAGVYFYVCDVYEIRLTGIEKRTLKGNIQLLWEGDKPPAE